MQSWVCCLLSGWCVGVSGAVKITGNSSPVQMPRTKSTKGTRVGKVDTSMGRSVVPA